MHFQWLKKNRSLLAVHGLIIGAFLFYVFFLADPLFNGHETTSDESHLHDTTLPPETNSVRYFIDSATVIDSTVELFGWAFLAEKGAPDSTLYIVLKSEENTYVFDANRLRRDDVPIAFPDLGIGAWCGFLATIPLTAIATGTYSIGFYLNGAGIDALQYTEMAIVWSRSAAKLTLHRSSAQDIELPAESEGLVGHLDVCQTTEDEGTVFLDLQGWAFVEGHDATDNTVFLVLKSDDATYVFNTYAHNRSDITATYEQLLKNLNHSGFAASIPAKFINDGSYEFGIYIRRGNLGFLRYGIPHGSSPTTRLMARNGSYECR